MKTRFEDRQPMLCRNPALSLLFNRLGRYSSPLPTKLNIKYWNKRSAVADELNSRLNFLIFPAPSMSSLNELKKSLWAKDFKPLEKNGFFFHQDSSARSTQQTNERMAPIKNFRDNFFSFQQFKNNCPSIRCWVIQFRHLWIFFRALNFFMLRLVS